MKGSRDRSATYKRLVYFHFCYFRLPDVDDVVDKSVPTSSAENDVTSTTSSSWSLLDGAYKDSLSEALNDEDDTAR